MTCGIYKITNLKNNKIYIGKSENIERRWKGHKEDSFCSKKRWEENKRGERTYFHKALRKNGVDAFSWEIIEECKKEELNDKEKYWIAFYNTFKGYGYNQTEGGDGYCFPKGENTNTAKLTLKESNDIKILLKKKIPYAEIIKKYPQASYAMISDINRGISWYDEKIQYPINSETGSRNFSDKEVLKIRKEYSNGANIKELAKKYNCNRNIISNMVRGKTYKHLPVYELKKEYIRAPSHGRKFSTEEVLKLRTEYYNHQWISILDYYNKNYKNFCNYAAFNNMIKGRTYKEVGGLPK